MTEGHSSGGCNRVVVPIGELLHELRQGGTSKGQSDKTECAAIFCTLENFETAVVYLSRVSTYTSCNKYEAFISYTYLEL